MIPDNRYTPSGSALWGWTNREARFDMGTIHWIEPNCSSCLTVIYKLFFLFSFEGIRNGLLSVNSIYVKSVERFFDVLWKIWAFSVLYMTNKLYLKGNYQYRDDH